MNEIWSEVLPAYGLAVLAAAVGLMSRCQGRGHPLRSPGSAGLAGCVVLLLALMSTAACTIFQILTDRQLLPWWAVALPLSFLVKQFVQISPNIKMNTFQQQVLSAVLSVGVVPLLESLDYRMISDRNTWVDQVIEFGSGLPIQQWAPEQMNVMADFTFRVIARATGLNPQRMSPIEAHVKDVRRHLLSADRKQHVPQEAYRYRWDAENSYRHILEEVYNWRLSKEYVRQVSRSPMRVGRVV